MAFLEQAIKKGYANISGEGSNQRITYAAVNHSERFADPEEQVRAEYWAELIFRYGYEPTHYHNPESVEHYKHWHNFAEKNLFGVEINDEIARVAKMNMILHDDGHTNVVGEDALERLEGIRKRTGNNGFKEDHFDLILTNPPFGAQVNLTERPYLPDFYLGNQEDAKGKRKPRKNQKTEVLFVERVWQFLKPGTGRAAVVLPDGILTNSSLQYVRDFLLERFQLLAVVSLPQTAFSHFGAGVKASLVFLRRRDTDEKPKDNEAIFMAAPEKIGYDATGHKCENQLPEVAEHYQTFCKNPIFGSGVMIFFIQPACLT